MAIQSLFKFSFLFIVSLQSLCFAIPTQVMHRPSNYQHEIKHSVEGRDISLEKRGGSKVQIGYFTNWGIYGRNFQPQNVITSQLTHILYSFADVQSDGTIILTDLYADEQKHYDGDSWSEPGNNLYGCLKQLYLMKQKQRNLKTLLSIGGYTYSQENHFAFVTDANARTTFVNSAVSMVENLGLDGIDLDFEYPSNTAQGSGFASLITSLRSAFNALASRKGDSTPYQITAAVSAGANNSAFLDVPTMDKSLTYWNLMAYDYAGSWLSVTDHQANLYGVDQYSQVSTDSAASSYISRGATASKITIGIPVYGRGFEQTQGLRQPYNGIGTGTWEAGVWDYKALPMPGATVVEDLTNQGASYSFDSSKGEFISYDTPNLAKLKAQYVVNKGMAGSMFWELSADKTGANSLIGTTQNVYGSLDQTQNHLSYPDSVWTNIANGMSGAAPTTTMQSTTTSTPTTTSSSPPATSVPPGGGSCAGVAAWVSNIAYTGGTQATYNGHLWTAKWWSQGDIPGGAAGDWTDNGAC